MKREVIKKVAVAAAAVAVVMLSMVGCGAKEEPQSAGTQVANPWQYFEDLESAEECAGFELGMENFEADSYKPASIGVMTDGKPLLEVVFQDDEYEVVIRKSQDVGQDISGVYDFEEADTAERAGAEITVYRAVEDAEMPNAYLAIFDHDGFAWSIYAPNGFWGDSCDDFLRAILGE